jgi:hypothetical protein
VLIEISTERCWRVESRAKGQASVDGSVGGRETNRCPARDARRRFALRRGERAGRQARSGWAALAKTAKPPDLGLDNESPFGPACVARHFAADTKLLAHSVIMILPAVTLVS